MVMDFTIVSLRINWEVSEDAVIVRSGAATADGCSLGYTISAVEAIGL